jgi:hypothetical protein
MTGEHYDGHHNIFGALDYELNNNQHMTLMFGEYVGYNYIYPEEHNSLTALDTRHIIRVVYSGEWGQPYKRKEGSSLNDSPNPMGEFNPPIPGASFVANFYPGWAEYTEKAVILPVKNRWDDYYGRMEFGVNCYDKEELEGGLRFGLFTSLQDKETSEYYDGRGTYLTSDTSLGGADINADLGWAINTPSRYVTFTPLINAGYRRIELKRSRVTDPTGASVAGRDGLDKTFNISYLGIGGKIDLPLYEKWSLYASGYAAPLVYAPSRTDSNGDFTINKGEIYHTEGGCEYLVSDKFNVNFGGFWDLQHLDRTERINSTGAVVAEFPDNKLKTLGVKLGGLYKF